MADIASLVGNQVPASILAVLIDGRALTAKELACMADVSPQTTSLCLAYLTSTNLITTEKQGCHRYYRLTSPLTGQMLASVSAMAGQECRKPRLWRGGEALRAARTCYGHLAGRLGIALADSLIRDGLLTLSKGEGQLTERGHAFIRDFGVIPTRGSSAFCRPCLDWSERRPHIAGRLGTALATRCLELRWLQRQPDVRAVTITTLGAQGFARTFGIHVPDLWPAPGNRRDIFIEAPKTVTAGLFRGV